MNSIITKAAVVILTVTALAGCSDPAPTTQQVASAQAAKGLIVSTPVISVGSKAYGPDFTPYH